MTCEEFIKFPSGTFTKIGFPKGYWKIAATSKTFWDSLEGGFVFERLLEIVEEE